jgi:hypothetical protein
MIILVCSKVVKNTVNTSCLSRQYLELSLFLGNFVYNEGGAAWGSSCVKVGIDHPALWKDLFLFCLNCLSNNNFDSITFDFHDGLHARLFVRNQQIEIGDRPLHGKEIDA